MSSYFCNTLLRGADHDEVVRAITGWQSAEGRVLDPLRQRFNLFGDDEQRLLYVLSRDGWTIVLASHDLEEAAGLGRLLAAFPMVLQLWAEDKAWGFRLEESGRCAALFNSKNTAKAIAASRDFREAMDRLAAACGCPERAQRLCRLASARFLFSDKRPAEFAAALGIPLATLAIAEVDDANAGIAEKRMVAGWTIQLLAFGRPTQDKPVTLKVTVPRLPTPTAKEQKEVARVVNWLRWLKWVFWPITALAGLLVMLLVGTLVLLNAIPGVRRLCFGGATKNCEEFVRQVRKSEPSRIRISGNAVTNLRHDCQVTLPTSARACAELLPRKGRLYEEPVFDIDLGKEFLACTAYPSKRLPRYAPAAYPLLAECLLETQESRRVNFRCRLAKAGNRSWHNYDWDIELRDVVFRFSLSSETELPASELNEFHEIVRSFRSLRSAAPRSECSQT